MSTTLLPHSADDHADHHADHHADGRGGRLLAWLRAYPRRAQAAVGGLAVCVGTGCAIGLGAGLAADGLVTILLGFVSGP